jgi:hypothetical protein
MSEAPLDDKGDVGNPSLTQLIENYQARKHSKTGNNFVQRPAAPLAGQSCSAASGAPLIMIVEDSPLAVFMKTC